MPVTKLRAASSGPQRDKLLLDQSIRQITLFSTWPESALQSLAADGKVIRVGKHAVLVRGDRVLGGLYAVVGGALELSLRHEDGKRLVRVEGFTGQIFGFVSVFSGLPTPHTYRALEPTVLIFIPKATLLNVLAKFPELWLTVVAEMSKLQLMTLSSLMAVTFESVRPRLAQALLGLAGDSAAHGPPTLPVVTVSQTHLGSLLGVSRQSINKELGYLARRAIVRTRYGRVELLDADVLREIAAHH